MSHSPPHGPKSNAFLSYDADFLNDSISINLTDDSFDGQKSNFFDPENSQDVPKPASSARTFKPGKNVPVNPDSKNYASSSHFTTSEPDEPCVCVEGTPSDQENQRTHPRKDKWAREIARIKQLEKERDWLREMNKILLQAANQMELIQHKFRNIQTATETSHELLDLYSKILTQTERTKDLVSEPNWQGLTADLERQEEAKRQEQLQLARLREQEREEQLQKAQEQQRQIEAQRLRESQTQKPVRGTSSRARGTSAGRTLRGQSRIGRMTR